MPKSLFIFDNNLNVLYCNNSFENTFGVKSGKFKAIGEGLSCATYVKHKVCNNSKDCSKCKLNAALNKCVAEKKDIVHRHFAKTLVTRVGSKEIDMVLNIRPLDDEHFLCVIDDITETEKVLSDEKRRNIKLFKDLDKAKDIQSSFLPVKSGLEHLCDFNYFYRQQFKVGGDFFNVYPIDDHTFGAYIADVSGAGMSGGMLTVFLRDKFDTAEKSPAAALGGLSHHFNRLKMSEESYITIFAAVVDTEKKTVSYCNGGHNQPMLLRRGKEIFDYLPDGKPVCNWYEDSSYTDSVISYETGDLLAFYTDGIPEMKDDQGVFYGEERLKEELKKGTDIYTTMKRIQKSLLTFNNGQSLDEDDITVLLIDLNH